jgi:threonine dehydrogenase-like Zn-dependent dehydrogenase
LSGGAEHCPTRSVLGIHNHDGVFADYVTLPITNLLPVPDGITDETAVFVEPLAAALRIREQVMVRPTMKTAVVGPGRLGILIGKVLSLAGTEVTMLGRRPASLALPAQWGLQTGLVDDFADNSFDFVVEATGNEAGFAQSMRLTRPLGQLILKSTFAGKTNLDLTKLVVDEISVTGSRCGPFAPALRLLAQGCVDVESSIEAEFALRDGVKALAMATGARKVLLRP